MPREAASPSAYRSPILPFALPPARAQVQRLPWGVASGQPLGMGWERLWELARAAPGERGGARARQIEKVPAQPSLHIVMTPCGESLYVGLARSREWGSSLCSCKGL